MGIIQEDKGRQAYKSQFEINTQCMNEMKRMAEMMNYGGKMITILIITCIKL